jgi:uncharacterized protein (TIGR03437 family)
MTENSPQLSLSGRRFSRRRTLASLAAMGSAAYFVPAWNETVEAADLVCVARTPTLTEGPYWVDDKLFRADIRSDPGTGVVRAGVPLTMIINVQNLSGSTCTPLAGAYVDIWHCDAKGIYSGFSQSPGGGTGQVDARGQDFLRGYQITDSNGQVRFTTIYPGWYAGRTIHIHVRVRTYSGNTVLSNMVSQIFFDEAVNNVVIASSEYTRTGARSTLNSNDNIYNNQTVLLAPATGSVAAGYEAAITMGAAFQVPTTAGPQIAAGGVANAMGGAAGLASGSWISIYGSNLASATRAIATSDIVNSTLPASLGGVSVQINNKPAFVHYVSANQVNVLAPADTATGPVSVSVTNSAGTSNAVSANLAAALPGLATANNYVRAVRYPDNAVINGTGAPESGLTVSAAVAQGAIISLYGTGFGAATGAPAAGQVFSGAFPTTNTVTVTIGGINAPVSFAGLVGPGLYQINVTVPQSLADGDHAVVAAVAGLRSQTSNALLKVAASARIANSGRLQRMLLGDRGPLPIPFRNRHLAWTNYLLMTTDPVEVSHEIEDGFIQLV